MHRLRNSMISTGFESLVISFLLDFLRSTADKSMCGFGKVWRRYSTANGTRVLPGFRWQPSLRQFWHHLHRTTHQPGLMNLLLYRWASNVERPLLLRRSSRVVRFVWPITMGRRSHPAVAPQLHPVFNFLRRGLPQLPSLLRGSLQRICLPNAHSSGLEWLMSCTADTL